MFIPLTEEDKQRIEGRKWANEAIEYTLSQSKDFIEGFCRALKVFFNSQEPKKASMMDKDEAIRFENERITFGKFNGSTWGEIPTSYIDWLVEQHEQLFSYVRSERYKERTD